MPDPDCKSACVAAYTVHVGTCNDVLEENLILAKTDAEKQLAKERFARCMELAEETKAICLETCGE